MGPDFANSARRGGELLAYRGKGRVGVLAEGRDGREADHDDQGQHDGVLDSRRAVFTLDELDDSLGEPTHDIPQDGLDRRDYDPSFVRRTSSEASRSNPRC